MMVDFDHAFCANIRPFTGGYMEVQTPLRRRISALTRNAMGFWVGVASNGEKGCRDHWNAKYKTLHPMQWMARVYETESEDFRNKMEAYLIEFYKEHSENKIRGTGEERALHHTPYTLR